MPQTLGMTMKTQPPTPDFADTPIPMPDGEYSTLGFSGEMVDCNNVSVPLDVLYNHHWLLKPIAGPMHHDNAPCPQTKGDSNDPYGLNRFTYVFGVGAESRKTPTVMPDAMSRSTWYSRSESAACGSS